MTASCKDLVNIKTHGHFSSNNWMELWNKKPFPKHDWATY